MSRMLVIAVVIAVVWSASATAQTTDDAWRAEFDRGQVAYDEGRFSDAYDIWLPLAESGICKAQFAMGKIFRDFDREYSSATSDQIRALTSRFKPDTLRIGLPHYYGFPDSIYSDSNDRVEFAAIYWFQRAATSGHPDAPYMAAVMLQSRFSPVHGVESPDSSTLLARFWLTVGAERGDEIAAFQLAWSYGTRDPEAATYWFLITEREQTGMPVTGRALNGVETLISADTFTYLKEQANEWEPRSPLDSAPSDCF